jgi:hypothetical protein
MLRMTTNVRDFGVQREIWFALGYAAALALELPYLTLTVTSFLDGMHKRQSLHFAGQAVDLRTLDLPPSFMEALAAHLKAGLEPYGFDVILESDHLHIEFDPKAGQQFIERVP